MKRQSQWLPIIVLIAALLLSSIARQFAGWARSGIKHDELAAGGQNESTAKLSGMDSFALALLLGGLRGPLVMILWSSSENQKSEKDLTGFDTQVEWIRLLQPDFDSVHIFQIWNKGYNISVQMASLANKYATVIDAIDYGEKVDRQRPNNINILASIAQIYFDKLGNAQEKEYYRRNVRKDTQWRDDRGARQVAIRQTRLAPRLDEAGNLLPEYITPTRPRPANVAPDAPWNDGAELQYLTPYAPYPYGLSPFALAYDYYKRAQVLQSTTNRRHTQLSQSVIDSRPAISLKSWSEDEWQRGRAIEAVGLNRRLLSELEQRQKPTNPWGIVLDDRAQLELVSADAPLDTAAQFTPDQLKEVLYSYDLTARLAEDAVKEYHRHMNGQGLQINFSVYASHIDHLIGVSHLAKADAAYTRLLTHTGDEADRQALAQTAVDEYTTATKLLGIVGLKYFAADEQLATNGTNDNALGSLSIPELVTLFKKLEGNPQQDGNMEDRDEYKRYVTRGVTRLELLKKAFPELKATPQTEPAATASAM